MFVAQPKLFDPLAYINNRKLFFKIVFKPFDLLCQLSVVFEGFQVHPNLYAILFGGYQ